jgi:hypothetical protein
MFQINRTPPLFRSLLLILALVSTATAQNEGDRILFIKAGSGTVGFLEGGSDEQAADIYNYTTSNNNHSWGELNDALTAEGFQLEQLSEDPVVNGIPTPVPFETMDLSVYAVIVFGSNNAEYSTAQVDAVTDYIANGGSALFISDANFGQDWGDAPSSDQHFLDRFGLTMNQDAGFYTIDRDEEFVVPDHPIFIGIDTIGGEGVSPITVGPAPVGVNSTVLATANFVRENIGPLQGSTRGGTPNDGSLVVATLGSGRVAGHYDRNTFFNLNGAGTNIRMFDNEAYARNLFEWLAGRENVGPENGNYVPRGRFLNLTENGTVSSGEEINIQVDALDPDGTVAYVDLFANGNLVARVPEAPYSWNVNGLSLGSNVLTAEIVDDQGASTTLERTIVVYSVINSSGWQVSGFKSNGDQVGNAGLAVDGDLSTRWATFESQVPGQYFRIDLGGRETVSRILLSSPNNANDYPRSYTVSGSHDGLDYRALVSGLGTNRETEIILPEPATYRFLEIRQTGSVSGSNTWWSIGELQVFTTLPDTVYSYSAWSLLHFGSDLGDPGKEPTIWGSSTDFDRDGQTNLEEFAFNTDPNDSTSHAEIIHSAVVNEGNLTHDFTFRRWKTSNGVEYQIQHSVDLLQWENIGFSAELIAGPSPNGDGTETVTYQIEPLTPESRSFIRLNLLSE